MIAAVAVSGTQVKSQQIGDAELTVQERSEELLHQYRSRPLVFLERYHVCAHSVYPRGGLIWAQNYCSALISVRKLSSSIVVQ